LKEFKTESSLMQYLSNKQLLGITRRLTRRRDIVRFFVKAWWFAVFHGGAGQLPVMPEIKFIINVYKQEGKL